MRLINIAVSTVIISSLIIACGSSGDSGSLFDAGSPVVQGQPDATVPGNGGGDNGGGLGGIDGGVVGNCKPKTCQELGVDCGPVADGCGALLQCGTCSAPSICGGGGTPSKCGGSVACVPKTCAQLASTCGPAGDGCGGALDCGTCAAPASCGGGGTPSTCGGTSACIPKTCAQLGATCGPAGDGCGGALNCGTCAAPTFCGGGGTPSTCGGGISADAGSTCVPKTCAQRGITCGPAGDGCGGSLSCGGCTAPQSCGGGGTPSVCGGTSICIAKTCAQLGITCGPAGDGCGGALNCGGCTAPQTCGGAGTPGTCGGFNACVPRTCAQAGASCGPIGDGCGGTVANCGTCTAPQICGGGGVASVCGPSSDGGVPCTGLCLNQAPCNAAGQTKTTLTGTVHAPSPDYLVADPIPGALVYVPNAPISAFPTTVTCDQCGAETTGKPLVSATTGADGKFTLTNVPAGVNFSVVVQIGRWRRVIPVTARTQCTTTPLADASTRLPRNKSEGDIPHMAMVTGAADPLECVLEKIGIDDSEFTDPTGNGRIHIYRANGATKSGATPDYHQLLASAASVAKYDQVLLACEGDEIAKTATEEQRLIDYAGVGGRVFATHFSYTWLYDHTPFSGTANWVPNAPANTASGWTHPLPNDPLTGIIDTSFPKGAVFSNWLSLVGASTTPGNIAINVARNDVKTVVAPSQKWISSTGNNANTTVQHYTFNTPVVPAQGQNQCGRVLFSDFHVNTSGSTTTATFPNECPRDFLGRLPALTAQEKVLEFMIFDLASCITPDVPVPPTCTPRSCADQGINCGGAGNGCGQSLDCGQCVAPQTCGGSGQPGVCGGTSCTPRTCAQQGLNCGPAGDGCGNALDCGPCTLPQTCGGGGTAGVCGAPSCTPRTCAQQGLSCGAAGDGCGGALNCGTCNPPFFCGGGGTPGVCGMGDSGRCTPRTCAAQGLSCGPAGDGCGNALDCGPCVLPQTCGGGGTPGVCGAPSCTKRTCADQGLSCGPAGDGCGGALDCGPCVLPQTCGGGGTPGVCGGPTCTPRSCASQGISCGPAGDGCGATLQCGTCVAPQTCGGGGQPGVCGGGIPK